MATAKFYTFAKRINSTKQPLVNAGTSVNVKLKQATSVENPTFILDSFNHSWNYVKFENTYYYINDVTYITNDLVEISCQVDYLATFKSDIGNTNAFIEYSTSQYNTLLKDTRISMTEEVNQYLGNSVRLSLGSNNNGTVVIRIAGHDTAAQVGLTSCYAISNTSLSSLYNTLFDDNILVELAKLWNNPYDAITECYWVPWNVQTTGDTIKIGNEDSGIVAKGLHAEMGRVGNSYTLTVPHVYGDFRDYQPYSQYELHLPFYGTVVLDAAKLQNVSSLTVNVILDTLSGEINYSVYNGTFIANYKCDMAVPLPVGQISGHKPQAFASVAGGAISLGAAMLTGGASIPLAAGAIIGGISALSNGIYNYFLEPAGAKGGAGGFATANQVIKAPDTSYAQDMYINQVSHLTSSTPASMVNLYGRPLMANRQISALSGYIKCAGASVETSGLYDDREQINAYLNGGFYYE